MRWFGEALGAYASDFEQAPVPVDESCGWCAEPIWPDDSGVLIPRLDCVAEVPYHFACHLRTVIGGINHQMRCCLCCGGDQPPDPPGLSLRAAADAAVAYWRARS